MVIRRRQREVVSCQRESESIQHKLTVQLFPRVFQLLLWLLFLRTEREILQAAADSAVCYSGSSGNREVLCYSPAPMPLLQTPPRSPMHRPHRLRPRKHSGSVGRSNPGGLQQNYRSPFKANVLTSLSKELIYEDFLCSEENVYLVLPTVLNH